MRSAGLGNRHKLHHHELAGRHEWAIEGDAARGATVSLDEAMTDEIQDAERAHRDQARSEEAHWQVAEAAAEQEEEGRSETDRQSVKQKKGRENKSAALGRDP
jgi:hypothetical protein